MKSETQRKLENLNTQFYEARAQEFALTRNQAWAGWEIIWQKIGTLVPKHPIVADIGCGNGRFGLFLLEKVDPGFTYIGIEPNKYLADMAIKNLATIKRLFVINLPQEDTPVSEADLVGIFGLMHHIPTAQKRLELISKWLEQLRPNGVLAVSFWQPGRNNNLFKRQATQLEIKEMGIDPEELTKNDCLLPFGDKPKSWRYVHIFSDQELDQIAESNSKRLVFDFKSDKFNRYLGFRKSPNP